MAEEREPVATLAHDLRSPLAVIELFAAMLEREGAALSPDQRADYAQRIRGAADEMRSLLDRATA